MKTEDYTPILESAGIRPTSTRLLIYEAIARNSDTFSLSTLERQLDSIDKSVIFRTLVLFHEHHLIHSVDDAAAHTNTASATTTDTATKKRPTATSIVKSARTPTA